MSWFENLAKAAEFVAKDLEIAGHEVAKHAPPTAKKIVRGVGAFRRNFDNAVQELGKHVTAENIEPRVRKLCENFDNATQQLGKHITAENIELGVRELRKNWNNAAREVGKATETARPHVGKAACAAKDLVIEASRHVTAENISIASEVVAEKARSHPTAVTVAMSGIQVALGSSIASVLLINMVGLLGFTSGGIAAQSGAASMQACIGNVASPGLFATVQSAAAGGYGRARIIRTVGGIALAVAALSTILSG